MRNSEERAKLQALQQAMGAALDVAGDTLKEAERAHAAGRFDEAASLSAMCTATTTTALFTVAASMMADALKKEG